MSTLEKLTQWSLLLETLLFVLEQHPETPVKMHACTQQHIKYMVKDTSCIPKWGQESGYACRSAVTVDVVGREVGNGGGTG